ncbi:MULTISPECIES: hypothetical protein [Providencia]|uniref:hypothetical protein n=1 Tax=Providencia TaxID=586 RepID=UPI001F04B4BA|nr:MULTISPECIES: hypothetical protein [Providencia]MCG9942713.1 hypothetical protein [Providencia rettgeri]
MLYNILYNSILFRGYRYLLRNILKKSDSNNAKFAYDILNSVKNIRADIFPMFGTLLSIYRDKTFLYADDFDFAIIGDFDEDIIKDFEKNDFELCAISTIGKRNKLVEISFHKKIDNIKVKVDVFKLTKFNHLIRHSCPNFRTGKGRFKIKKGIKICEYDSYFNVDYPYFNLSIDNNFNIVIPSNPKEIFEAHYGNEWQIRKSKNFIDFKSYQFKTEISRTITGTADSLKNYIKDHTNNNFS